MPKTKRVIKPFGVADMPNIALFKKKHQSLMIKRIFDIVFSTIVLFLVGWIVLLFYIFASIDTRQHGLFVQERIGQYGKKFTIYKLRTIYWNSEKQPIISFLGRFLRKSKIDELPQLINVLKGDMSIVGPRPDVAGYYDLLQGENRKILELKPGLTSLASIKYAHEEAILAGQKKPLQYNDEVLFPDKVKMNLEYYQHHSFIGDLIIIWKTIFRTTL